MKEFNLWRDSNLKSREEILNIILLIPQEKGTRIKKKKEDGGLGREISLNAWKMLTSMEITQRRH